MEENQANMYEESPNGPPTSIPDVAAPRVRGTHLDHQREAAPEHPEAPGRPVCPEGKI